MVVGICASILVGMNDIESIPVMLQLINSSRTTWSEILIERIALFNGDQMERRILDSLATPKLKEHYRHQVEGKQKRRPSPAQ
jgi:hypothetical protein